MSVPSEDLTREEKLKELGEKFRDASEKLYSVTERDLEKIHAELRSELKPEQSPEQERPAEQENERERDR